jgi:hypothetical protein
MRLPWMTTRRWLIVVAVAAVMLRAVDATRSWRRHFRYAAAIHAHEATMRFFNLGRVTLTDAVLSSQRLMDEELRLSSSAEDRTTAFSSHLRRADGMIKGYRRDLELAIHCDVDAEIAEAEATLAGVKAIMRRSERGSSCIGRDGGKRASP